MSIGLAFWVLMLLWLIFGLWWSWPGAVPAQFHGWFPVGGTVLIFILFLLLGWHAFGPPIHG
jgi:hypothetical protein